MKDSYSSYLLSLYSSTKYKGLFLTSINILPKYSPIIPNDINWIPPNNNIIQIKLAYPGTSTPLIIVLKKINTIYFYAPIALIVPNIVAILNGATVNDVIPSIAKSNNLK